MKLDLSGTPGLSGSCTKRIYSEQRALSGELLVIPWSPLVLHTLAQSRRYISLSIRLGSIRLN